MRRGRRDRGREEPLYGEALYQVRDKLPTYRAHNEQAMAHSAIAYAKAMRRRRMMACTKRGAHKARVCGFASSRVYWYWVRAARAPMTTRPEPPRCSKRRVCCRMCRCRPPSLRGAGVPR